MIRIDRTYDERGTVIWESEPYDDGEPDTSDPATRLADLEAQAWAILQEIETIKAAQTEPPPA